MEDRGVGEGRGGFDADHDVDDETTTRRDETRRDEDGAWRRTDIYDNDYEDKREEDGRMERGRPRPCGSAPEARP